MIIFYSAIWVWKGQNLAFELSEDWQIDYASYEWSKLDPKVHFSHNFMFYLACIIIHDISYSKSVFNHWMFVNCNYEVW